MDLMVIQACEIIRIFRTRGKNQIILYEAQPENIIDYHEGRCSYHDRRMHPRSLIRIGQPTGGLFAF
eukprot:9248070-Karenia_brevis.AAC.1